MIIYTTLATATMSSAIVAAKICEKCMWVLVAVRQQLVTRRHGLGVLPDVVVACSKDGRRDVAVRKIIGFSPRR